MPLPIFGLPPPAIVRLLSVDVLAAVPMLLPVVASVVAGVDVVAGVVAWEETLV